MAGVSLARLLDGGRDVTLLEAAGHLGGHALSLDTTLLDGRDVVVDAGAQHFGPKSHPTYWKLLNEVLHVPTVAAPINLTVAKPGGRSRRWPPARWWRS